MKNLQTSKTGCW